jgi:CBS-domain-containing membrane protein
MLVKDLMKTDVVTVKTDTLVSEVAEILHTRHFSGLPVVNDDGKVVGTISEKDFLTADSGLYLPTYIQLLSGMDYVQGGERHLPHVVQQIVGSTAKDIMSHEIIFAHPDTTLEQLAETFAETQANPIPVTDNDNNLLGIVSRSDLIKMFSPNLVKKAYVAESRKGRMIDQQVKYTQRHFNSNFAYVAKARANIWLTAIIVLFIVGFLAGIVYVADPNIFVKQESGFQQQ